MGITTVTTIDKAKPGVDAGGNGLGRPGGDGPFDGPPYGPGDKEDGFDNTKYRIGMWVGLGSVVMLFAALTSAYILRQTKGISEGSGENAVHLPSLLWLNTAFLMASSITFELARRSLARSGFRTFNRLMVLTTMLGAAFLVGQLIAWRQLAAQGVYLVSSAHSSFFYLLTSLHGIHLLGGVAALLYVTVRGFRFDFGPKRRIAVDVTATYWHFMDGLWVYLFLLLFYWR